jgi:hypothetical protein
MGFELFPVLGVEEGPFSSGTGRAKNKVHGPLRGHGARLLFFSKAHGASMGFGGGIPKCELSILHSAAVVFCKLKCRRIQEIKKDFSGDCSQRARKERRKSAAPRGVVQPGGSE